jgi:hypothetical protein
MDIIILATGPSLGGLLDTSTYIQPSAAESNSQQTSLSSLVSPRSAARRPSLSSPDGSRTDATPP